MRRINRVRFGLLLLVAAFSLFLIAYPVATYLDIVRNGQVIYLEIDPLAPISATAPGSIVFRYPDTSIEITSADEAAQLKSSQTIYAMFETDPSGKARIVDYSTKPPPYDNDGVWLMVKITSIEQVAVEQDADPASPTALSYIIRCAFPFTRVYFSPDIVLGAESLLSRGGHHDMGAAVAVHKNRAVVRSVFVDNETLSDFIRRSILAG